MFLLGDDACPNFGDTTSGIRETEPNEVRREIKNHASHQQSDLHPRHTLEELTALLPVEPLPVDLIPARRLSPRERRQTDENQTDGDRHDRPVSLKRRAERIVRFVRFRAKTIALFDPIGDSLRTCADRRIVDGSNFGPEFRIDDSPLLRFVLHVDEEGHVLFGLVEETGELTAVVDGPEDEEESSASPIVQTLVPSLEALEGFFGLDIERLAEQPSVAAEESFGTEVQ